MTNATTIADFESADAFDSYKTDVARLDAAGQESMKALLRAFPGEELSIAAVLGMFIEGNLAKQIRFGRGCIEYDAQYKSQEDRAVAIVRENPWVVATALEEYASEYFRVIDLCEEASEAQAPTDAVKLARSSTVAEARRVLASTSGASMRETIRRTRGMSVEEILAMAA